jgi:hypothetical protein
MLYRPIITRLNFYKFIIFIISYLYSMVFLVTYIYEAQRVRGDAPRVIELSISSSLAAKGSKEPTLRVKDL